MTYPATPGPQVRYIADGHHSGATEVVDTRQSENSCETELRAKRLNSTSIYSTYRIAPEIAHRGFLNHWSWC